MEVRRLYLDANVLITLGEGSGEVADLLTELVLQEQGRNPPFLCTSELTLSELLVQPIRDGNGDLIAKYDGWLVSGTFMEVGVVDRSTLWLAATLRSAHRSIKLPDAIHIATGLRLGCSHMLTADTRIPSDIDIAMPSDGSDRIGKLRIVRPEPNVLRDIIREQRDV